METFRLNVRYDQSDRMQLGIGRCRCGSPQSRAKALPSLQAIALLRRYPLLISTAPYMRSICHSVVPRTWCPQPNPVFSNP